MTVNSVTLSFDYEGEQSLYAYLNGVKGVEVSNPFTLDGLTEETLYKIKVGNGIVFSNEVSVTTKGVEA